MDIKKILVFNPFGIGDVLFTMPLLQNLRENLPGVDISYLCNARVYPLLKNSSFLNEVLVFEKDQWREIAKKSKLSFLKKFVSFYRQIKKTKFDIIFDLSMNSQYGLFFKMTGIRMRIGLNFKKRGRFLTHKIDMPKGYSNKHVAIYYLDLLKFLNITPKNYSFNLGISNSLLEQQKESILKRYDMSKGNLLVGVCPGSGDSWGPNAYFKRWPKENFVEVCRYLQSKPNTKLILFGSNSEKALAEDICDKLDKKPLNLCGYADLPEFYNIVSLCSLIITNDGGPFHVAQELNKKIISFFGPVSDKVYGPYPDSTNCIVLKKDLPCQPCYQVFKFKGCQLDKACLRQISIDEAIEAIKKMLG